MKKASFSFHKILFSILGACATFVAVDSVQDIETRQFEEPLSISVRKSIPPLAAVEDEIIQTESLLQAEVNVPSQFARATRLIAGSDLLAKNYLQQSIVNTNLNQPRTIEIKESLVLSKEDHLVATNVEMQSGVVSNAPVIVDQPVALVNENVAPKVSYQKFVQTLPTRLKNRLAQVEGAEQLLQEDWSQPSLEQAIKNINSSAEGNPENNGMRVIGRGQEADRTPVVGSASVAPNRNVIAQNKNDTIEDKNKMVSLLGGEVASQDEITSYIRGQIEITEGLAYMGRASTLRVYRETIDGNVEEGFVRAKDGTFEITVSQLQGILVATLQGPSGEMLGLAETAMEQLGLEQKNRGRIENVVLQLKPVVSTLRGVVQSADAFVGQKRPLNGVEILLRHSSEIARTDKRGKFEVENIRAGSSMALKISQPGYWDQSWITNNEKEAQAKMLPLKMAESIRQIVQDSNKKVDLSHFEDFGIIYGSVQLGGKPASGIKVEASGSGLVGPIYFNSWLLPDVTMKATGENGKFIFLNVESGPRILRAIKNKTVVTGAVIQVDVSTVSGVELNIGDAQTVEVSVADMFTGKSLTAQVRSMLSESTNSTNENGRVKILHQGTSSVSYVECLPGDNYIPLRTSVVAQQKQLQIPAVTEAWLRQKMQQLRRSFDSETVVIGLFGKSAANVSVDADLQANASIVVYFDESGNLLQPYDTYKTRAGFLIIGLPVEVTTVVFNSTSGQPMSTQVVLPEVGTVSFVQPR